MFSSASEKETDITTTDFTYWNCAKMCDRIIQITERDKYVKIKPMSWKLFTLD